MRSLEILKHLSSPGSSRLAIAALASAASMATSFAQDGDATEDEQIFELSPFEVNAADDEGYRARNTLAGSRISTSLKDVAAAITEITPEFLDDVGAADINDVLVYTAGTESTRSYTDAPKSGIGGYDDGAASSPNSANRIRGLHSAQLMRDYFVTIGTGIGFDAYNVDRVTINRGPNSVLFGLGDPSGSVNYASKTAHVTEDSGEVSARFGSHSDLRATIDVNKVLQGEKLAVRVAGLWSDRGFEQEPSKYQDERIYLTTTYKPFEKTTLRGTFERAEVEQHMPNTITPIDHVSTWEALGRPTWNAATQNWSERPSFFGVNANGTVGATAPDGSLDYAFVDNQGERGFASFFRPTQPGVFVYSHPGVRNNDFVDLHSVNLRPSRSEQELDTILLNWNQQVTKDLYFDVAYLNEDASSSGNGWFRANQFAIHPDVNETLPDGTPNPHFGELYMPQRSLDSLGESDSGNEAVRATATYSLRLDENDNWTRWLGRHSFTGYAEKRTSDRVSRGYNGTRTGNPPYLDPADKINAGNWQITYLRYLGSTADGQVQHPAGVAPDINESGVPHTYWDATAGAWAEDTWGHYFARKRMDISESEVTSEAFVWQGYFWEDRIVGLFGMRSDEETRRNHSITNRNPATGETDFPSDPFSLSDFQESTESAKGDTKTYGVVVHPTDWLSLHYNKSETIQVFAGSSLNLLGEPIPLPAGPGKDYGFSLDLFEGKLYTRVNWYETDITDARMDFLGPVVAGQWELPWFDQEVIPAMAAQYGETWGADKQFTSITYGDGRIGETTNESAEGIEIEVTYNPTKNWRIMANATKQKAVQSNIAPGLSKWKEEVLPVWQAQPWWDGPIPGDFVDPWGASSASLRQSVYNYNSGRVLDTFKAFEGQSNPQLREWRFNMITNYSFDDGAFKGWNVGGALRWADSAAIGFPAVTEVINGTETLVGLDLANAYYDSEKTNVDAWIGYTRRVWNDQFDWNVQLNVRDIGRSDNLQPIVKNSDGTTATYRIEFGPTWYLSSSLSW